MPAAGRTGQEAGRQRRTLRVALLASLVLHGVVLLVLAWRLPSQAQRPVKRPVTFTLVERPARAKPATRPSADRPAAAAATAPGRRQATPLADGVARPRGAVGFAVQPDAPFVVPGAPSRPSLPAMSAEAAAAVVRSRGPQRAPGHSVGGRLRESLRSGVGAMAVAQLGFWDTYFGEVRKLLLLAWSVEHVRAHGSKASARIRLVLDGDGLLRDFDILIGSGDAVMDADVVRALHQTPHFPLPPAHVMDGKLELVTEWEFTVHPALAQAQGEFGYGGLTAGVIFDLVTLANPSVDLKPLERNVALATYYTR